MFCGRCKNPYHTGRCQSGPANLQANQAGGSVSVSVLSLYRCASKYVLRQPIVNCRKHDTAPNKTHNDKKDVKSYMAPSWWSRNNLQVNGKIIK